MTLDTIVVAFDAGAAAEESLTSTPPYRCRTSYSVITYLPGHKADLAVYLQSERNGPQPFERKSRDGPVRSPEQSLRQDDDRGDADQRHRSATHGRTGHRALLADPDAVRAGRDDVWAHARQLTGHASSRK